MSRKKTQPKKKTIPDPKFNSTIIPKLINNLMYDGKKGVAAKIVYEAKINICLIKFSMNFSMLMKKKELLLKNERMYIKWLSQIKLSHILDGKKLWLDLIH